ncbi:MAG: Phosphoesterase, PA-phosphatase related protein [Candidatus Saccharibacteria bacterium]|nr:Phosphoesterase, PA-phosphatase related protein [Candidatus Saccharibacteria bacterium]
MSADFLIRLIADYSVIAVVLIGAWAILFKVPKGQRFKAYSRILMAGLTAYMLAKFLASVYQPSDLRPFELLGVDPGASYLNNPGFPSDHALFVTAIAAAVWFETRMKKLSIVLAALVVVVCIGRVLALVHTPFDVIAGVIIAIVGALWYSNEPRTINENREIHGHGKSHSRRTNSSRKTVVGES